MLCVQFAYSDLNRDKNRATFRDENGRYIVTDICGCKFSSPIDPDIQDFIFYVPKDSEADEFLQSYLFEFITDGYSIENGNIQLPPFGVGSWITVPIEEYNKRKAKYILIRDIDFEYGPDDRYNEFNDDNYVKYTILHIEHIHIDDPCERLCPYGYMREYINDYGDDEVDSLDDVCNLRFNSIIVTNISDDVYLNVYKTFGANSSIVKLYDGVVLYTGPDKLSFIDTVLDLSKGIANIYGRLEY